MVSLGSLLVPVVLSAVLVFAASSLIWMFLPWHKKDWRLIEREDAIMGTIRDAQLSPGQYMFPRAASRPSKTWSEDEARKVREGPMGSLVVWPPGPPQMGKSLPLWFVLLLVISYLVAYLASRTLAPGAEYLTVFRLTSTVAFLAYSGALPVQAIFYGHSWGSTVRSVLDGLLYGLLTGGVFGWLWPEM